MKKIYYILFLCLLSIPAHAQFSATLAGSSIVTTGWSYGGDARTHDSVMQLTTPAGSELAYCNYSTEINMAGYCQWTADFDFQIIPHTGTLVADGICFYFLNNPPPTGTGGGGIGISTDPNGLILILDTYDNDGDGNNPLATLEGYSGSTTGYTEGAGVGVVGSVAGYLHFIDDGNWHHCKVTYNSGNVNVYFNYSTTATVSGYYYLGISGYFGFCSSTGGAYSTQSIKQVYITAAGCLTPENNGPLCPADSLQLYAYGDSTGATYAWTGPNGFTSTLQFPNLTNVTLADSGLYRVIKTVAGVADTGYTVVDVKHNPRVTASSNSLVCAGTTIDLTATPDSTGETFSWTGPGSFVSALQNPTISGASYADTGTYTVIATWNGCLDTASTHVGIVYVPTPTDSNNTPTCIGYAVDLFSSDSSSSVSYFWTGPSGFTSRLQNPTIGVTTIANAGTYTVTVSIGSCTATATTVVTLSPTPPVPVIDTLHPLCSGQDLHLIAYDTSGATYNWTGPDGFTSTLQNPTITGIATAGTGLYTVIAAYGGCAAPPATAYALVDSTPVIPTATVTGPPLCSGETISFTAFSSTVGVAYSWLGPDTFAAAAQDTFIVNAQTYNSGNYTVTVTKGICHSQAVVPVTVNQTPSIPTLTSTAPLCSGGLLTLGATATPGTGTYYWTGPNSFTSSLQYPTILGVTVPATGTYSVHEVVNGCSSPYGSINVVIYSTPDVPGEWSNSPVCQGDTLKLHASDDTLGVGYSWAGPMGFVSYDQNPIITPAPVGAGGIYTVTVTLGTCSASQVINAVVIPSPALIATSNSPVCTGDTLKLQATSAAGNTFTWTGPFSYTGAGSAPTRFPTVAEFGGVYVVTVTDVHGCFTVGTDTVVVQNTPDAPWVNWLTYCQNAYAPPLMAIDATNVLWYATDAGTGGVAAAPTPSTTTPGVYFFYLNQSVNGCASVIDSIQVKVNPKPFPTLTPNVSAICPHDSVVYTTVDADPFDTYRWFPSLYLNDSLISSPVSKPVASVNYELVTTNEFSCADTQYAAITVYESAVILINAGDSVVLYPGQSYHIQPQTNCTSFLWFPPVGLSNPNVADPIASPTESTIYVVEGSTEHGCVTRDSIAFHVNNETVYGVPNAFTPGNGQNNLFKLYTVGPASLNHFRIYNRWGELVFETTNDAEGWDGTFNGTPQPFGVYVYDIQAVSGISGNVVNMRGNLTLIR